MLFRSAVTLETPAHAELFLLVDHFHLVNATMAGNTAYPSRDMRAVVEIGIVRQVVYLDPFDGNSCRMAFAHWQKLRTVLPHQTMTVHARLRRRKSRKARLVNCIVAVAAVDPELTGVQRVTVGNRLLGLVSNVSGFGRKPIPDESSQVDRSATQGDSRDLPGFVGPAGEDEQLHRKGPVFGARSREDGRLREIARFTGMNPNISRAAQPRVARLRAGLCCPAKEM